MAGILPWLRSLAGGALPVHVSLAIDRAFASVCHHLPDRTLFLAGSPMSVCSRCAGLYFGVAIAGLVPARPTSQASFKRALELGLVLMGVDILTQDLGIHPPFHPVRLLTGAWVGFASTAWLLASCPSSAPRRELARGQRFSARLS